MPSRRRWSPCARISMPACLRSVQSLDEQHSRRAGIAAEGGAAAHRCGRWRALVRRAEGSGGACRSPAASLSLLRSMAKARFRAAIRCRSASWEPIPAKVPTAWCKQADLIFYVGSEAGGMTTNFWAVPAVGAPTIQVDINPEVLGRNYPLKGGDLRRRESDACRACSNIADRSTAAKRLAWNETISSICREWREKYRAIPRIECRADSSGAYLPRIDATCAGRRHRLCRHRPCGHVDGWHVRYAHQQGKAISAALAISAGLSRPGSGAKCACPDRPVVVFTGDAGFWYHIAEDRNRGAARNINTVTVVNNNSSGNQSKPGFDRVYGGTKVIGHAKIWTFSKVNFARIAEDMGAVGIRVESPAGFPAALSQRSPPIARSSSMW